MGHRLGQVLFHQGGIVWCRHAAPGQGQEVLQGVPPGQEIPQLPGQPWPVVVQAHQPPHQGLPHRVVVWPEIQPAAQLLQGLLLLPFRCPVILQELKFQGDAGLMGRGLEELGAKAVKGADREPFRHLQELVHQVFLVQVPEGPAGQFMYGRFVGGRIGAQVVFVPKILHDPLPELPRGLAGKGQGQDFPG